MGDYKDQVIDMCCERLTPIEIASKIASKIGITVKEAKEICYQYTHKTKLQREAWLAEHGWDWIFVK